MDDTDEAGEVFMATRFAADGDEFNLGFFCTAGTILILPLSRFRLLYGTKSLTGPVCSERKTRTLHHFDMRLDRPPF